MGRPCVFCLSPRREELEKRLLERTLTQIEVADILKVRQSRVSTHMGKHVQTQVSKAAAPDYIKVEAKKKLDKISMVKSLVQKLNERVRILLETEVNLQNETSLAKTVNELQKGIMNLAKLEGELGPEVEVNIQIQVKEYLQTLIKSLPVDLRTQIYSHLKGQLQGGPTPT